jgi:hypothetical protein
MLTCHIAATELIKRKSVEPGVDAPRPATVDLQVLPWQGRRVFGSV